MLIRDAVILYFHTSNSCDCTHIKEKFKVFIKTLKKENRDFCSIYKVIGKPLKKDKWRKRFQNFNPALSPVDYCWTGTMLHLKEVKKKKKDL